MSGAPPDERAPVTPLDRRRPALAVVVQRYGADINGGAELHSRYIAEHLSPHADVRVLTTCARDYVTWRNELPPGRDSVNGIRVERFPVTRERNVAEFGRRSARVFDRPHSWHDELTWLESEGPTCPALIRRLRDSGGEFDYVLFFSLRYYQAYYGARAVPDRAILVPTAEREASLGLAVFPPVLRGVRAIMYNSPEERLMLERLSGTDAVPGVVVGVGSEIPAAVHPEDACDRFGLRDPFVIYVGRIDTNKGCRELFDHFLHYVERSGRPLDLVLVGTPVMRIPEHPRIRHLGFVSDQDKFDLIAASRALIMPSFFESLSMVALEAWALGRPVLANARCDVLVGQCLRSNGGLYYDDGREFAAALDLLLDRQDLAAALGRHGRDFYQRHYDWPVIVGKYLDMFALLATTAPRAMAPLPGLLARRRRTLPPARTVLDAVPAGPAEWAPEMRA